MCEETFLGIPAWFNGVAVPDGRGGCDVNFDGTADAFLVIGANLVQTLFFIVGYVAVAYLIYGGITFITAQGDPQGLASAKKRIESAIIGLFIAIFAWAITTFVVFQFGEGVTTGMLDHVAGGIFAL